MEAFSGQHRHANDPGTDTPRHIDPVGGDFAVIHQTFQQIALVVRQPEEKGQPLAAWLGGSPPPDLPIPEISSACAQLKAKNEKARFSGYNGQTSAKDNEENGMDFHESV